jgi:mRNA interferase HigB
VNVIAFRTVRLFLESLPEAERESAHRALRLWYNCLRKLQPRHYADLKAAFSSVDTSGEFVIFDVGGNKYRIIAVVIFENQRVYVRHVFTHTQYDIWNETRRRRKR